MRRNIMEINQINDILDEYTAGGTSVEEANEALKEAGASFHLDPQRNELTEEELNATAAGETPEEADGFGLLDTGTGTLDKVRVTDGRLEYAVNQVQADGSTNMHAVVLIGGKRYEVRGDKLAEAAPQEPVKREKLPKTPDLRRRSDLAGREAVQCTLSGEFRVSYDADGYAVRAVRAGGENGGC